MHREVVERDGESLFSYPEVNKITVFQMNSTAIVDAITPVVTERGLFIVDISVSKDNDIIVTIESQEGEVRLEDCEAVDKVVSEAFSRDVEDYSLTVTSAGLDQPFKILRQYRKAIGTQVEVALKGGRRFIATLKDVTDDGAVTFEHTVLKTVEGRKKKEPVVRTETVSIGDHINSVRPYIDMSKY